MSVKSYLIGDTETQSREMFNRVAHFKHNKIVAVGLKSSTGEEKIEYIYPNKLQKLEIDEEVFVLFNAKFDLLHLWEVPGIQEYFMNNGELYDPMIAEYFMSGQTHKFPGLRDIAVNKYGAIEREKKMEAYWDRGIDTSEIPRELVLEDLREDVRDTERVYLGQQNLLNLQQKNLLKVQNDLCLALTECEYNGIYVDRGILEKNQLELEARLENLTNELNEVIKPYWRIENERN